MAGWSDKHRLPKGWTKLRQSILAAEPLCRPCIKAANRPTPATAVDHVLATAFGGGHEPSNLMPICGDCHKIKTGMEAAKASGRRYKLRPTFDVSGWPIEQPVHDYIKRLVERGGRG